MNQDNQEVNESLYFKVHGDYITNFIRSLCLEGNPIHSWNVFKTLTDTPDEAIEVYRNIIKGTNAFSGVNNLTLEEVSSTNLVEEILHNIRRGKQCEISEDYFTRNLRELEEGEEQEDYTEQNALIRQGEEKRIEQLTFFVEKMGLTMKQAEEMVLKSLHSEDYTHPFGGWITDRGTFIPVDYCQHDNHLYSLFERGYVHTSEVSVIERRWVRLSSVMGEDKLRGMNIAAYDFNISAKQKITLEKIIKARKMLTKEGQSIQIFGYGQIVMENGQIKFERRGE